MNQKHFIFSMISLLFTIDVNASTIQNKKPIIDKFLSQLKNNIELNEKYQQSIAKQSHTITSIAGTDIGIKDFLGMCQSLYGKGKSDEMVSVVTVRYSNKGEKYNASDFLKEFMYAIQEHAETGQKIIYHDTLCITVDYIKQTDLGVFDMLNTTTKQIRKIRQKYNEIVIDHFHEIAYTGLRSFLARELVSSLFMFFDDEAIENFDKETLDQYAESAYECTAEDLVCIESTDVFDDDDATWEIDDPNSIYNTICAKISEYEESINFEYYTSNSGGLKKHFNYLINCRHREVLTKNINDLALLCMPITESPDNKKKFKDIFTTTCIRLLHHMQSDSSQMQYPGLRHYIYTNEILETSEIKEAIENFCNSIILNEIQNKFKELVHKSIAPLYQELSADMIVTVVCNNRINDQNIIHMCRVLNDSKIIEDLHDNQIIHIENGSLVTKEQIDINVTNLQLKDLAGKNCPIAVRTLSTSAPANGESEVLSYQLLLHTFQISKDGTCEWISQSDTRNLPDDKSISIDTAIEYDRTITNAITTCVENSNSKIAGHHTIAITNSTESVYLHILHHLPNDQKKPEILSLIYDIQPKRKGLVHLHPMMMQRQIKCLDHVPTSLLRDLGRYLQFLLVKNQKFEIPNQVTLKNGQRMQIENTTFDIRSKYPKHYVRQRVEELYNCKDYLKIYRCIPLRELIEHEFNKPPANSWDTFCIPDSINISRSKLNEILYTIIMKKHAITNAEIIPHAIDKFCMAHEIEMYFTHYADGSVILNICETEENIYNAKISINPYTVYAGILENKEFARIIDAFDYMLRGLGFSRSFAAMIFNDIYKRKTHGISGCLKCCVIKYQKRYTDMVTNLVDRAIKLDQDNVYNTSGNVQSPRSLYQHALLDIMKEEKVKQLIEAIVTGLHEITSKRLMKITTVKIGTTSDDSSMCNKLKKMKLVKDEHQYENLAHLTCLGCQEYNKSNDDG